MFDLKTSCNSLGVALTLVGVYAVYKNSPLNVSVIDGGGAGTDFQAVEAQASRGNRNMKLGVYAVMLGSALQLASNYIPAGVSC